MRRADGGGGKHVVGGPSPILSHALTAANTDTRIDPVTDPTLANVACSTERGGDRCGSCAEWPSARSRGLARGGDAKKQSKSLCLVPFGNLFAHRHKANRESARQRIVDRRIREIAALLVEPHARESCHHLKR